jgi:sterol desaturase/sphingolipid hydroxylase (fatty acid hydroxylase superfamily)
MGLDEWIVANEAPLRLGLFIGILLLMMMWEFASPRRQLQESRLVRWANNLGLVFLNTILLRWLFPLAAVGVAVAAREQGWGVMNHLGIEGVWAVVIAVVILDMAIYLQHVMVHAVPLLWRLHRVHHADLDYDVTTGARFHPIEIVLSMLIKFAVILLLGPPVVAVILFEVILNGMAMFNHGNIRLPLPLDRVLRMLLVTPDMHRVHHSVEDDEANSNFGFNLSIWDRLFGTYTAQPRAGHEGMTIGIHKYRSIEWCGWLPGMLAMPFVGKISRYAINRRNWEGQG